MAWLIVWRRLQALMISFAVGFSRRRTWFCSSWKRSVKERLLTPDNSCFIASKAGPCGYDFGCEVGICCCAD
ncbi:hypothetical protein V6N13_035145 [Hibiscus sabdariffa]